MRIQGLISALIILMPFDIFLYFYGKQVYYFVVNTFIMFILSNMKRFFFLPKISMLSVALIITSSIIIVSDMGCTPKPACGNKRDHRRRKKSVKRFAPSMSYMFLKPTEERYSFFA